MSALKFIVNNPCTYNIKLGITGITYTSLSGVVISQLVNSPKLDKLDLVQIIIICQRNERSAKKEKTWEVPD